MVSYSVAFIGTGPEPENQVWGESAAMAYRHGWGYDQHERCELVACADIVRENAEAFADEFAIPRDHVFEDATAMLEETSPDIVSIATPVPTHADIVAEVIETGVPDAIHCEKPMADTWGDSRRMAQLCQEADVQLTFNHQRRFDPRWREAKRLLDDGAIGDLERLEMGGKNLFDFGTHIVDLCNYYNDERDPEWVLAGLDYREKDVRYGSHNENQAVALWEYENGLNVFASTGKGPGSDVVSGTNRLIGTDGVIEVQGEEPLRVRRAGQADWESIEIPEVNAIARGIEHVVECLDTGEEPELGANNALRAMKIIFGAYESVRSRRRVEFPLEIDDNPLEALVDAGELNPAE